MPLHTTINHTRAQRRARVRSRLTGTATRPRLSVFRSNRYTYAQCIDDAVGRVLFSASTRGMKVSKGEYDEESALGTVLAEKALALGIKNAVFDRGHYAFHGRVRRVAESARKAGLTL